MKLVNMKQEPEKSEKEIAAASMPHGMDKPRYPYGLCITLDAKSLETLGIKELPKVGTAMKLQANVEVVAVAMNESAFYGDTKRVELQITDMAIGGAMEEKEDKE